MFKKIFIFFLISSFILSPFPAFSQALELPPSGTMIMPSNLYVPTLLKGIKLNTKNPLKFSFIIDSGNNHFNSTGKSEFFTNDPEFKEESEKLIKYFLAALTIPDQDLWVNLSPNEPERIIPEALGQTELGRDLLIQDYVLKQLTASLMYPEGEIGRPFWEKLYNQAYKKYGTIDIPMDTFNKVWIVPETANVYTKENTVFVVEAKLKVLSEEDYISLSDNEQKKVSLETELIKELILPAIEKEVNEGENFAPLRQIYHALILAKWYKDSISQSILSSAYVNQNKIQGINTVDVNDKDLIYERYMNAFKMGVYDYIKEEYDPKTQEVSSRKYFSGGFKSSNLQVTDIPISLDKTKSEGAYHEVEVGLDFAIASKKEKGRKFQIVEVPQGIVDGEGIGRVVIIDEPAPDLEFLKNISANSIVATINGFPASDPDIGPFEGILKFTDHVSDFDSELQQKREQSWASMHAKAIAEGVNIPYSTWPGSEQKVNGVSLKDLNGRLVRMKVQGGVTTLSEVSQVEYDAYLKEKMESLKKKQIQLPDVNLKSDMLYISSRTDLPELKDPLEVGYKVAMRNQLKDVNIKLSDRGIDVFFPRDSGIINFTAFKHFVDHSARPEHFYSLLRRLNEVEETAAAPILKKIRNYIMSDDFRITDAFWKKFEHLGGMNLVSNGAYFRDSNIAQNMPQHKKFGGGQYLTIANVVTEDRAEIEKQLKILFAHIWWRDDPADWPGENTVSSQSPYYHRMEKGGIDETKLFPAVEIISSRKATYSFLIETSSSENSNILRIYIVQGQGDSLMAGGSDDKDSLFSGRPTVIEVDKLTGEIVQTYRSTKEKKAILRDEGGLDIVDVDPAKEFLDWEKMERIVKSMVEFGIKAEKALGKQEIEGSILENVAGPIASLGIFQTRFVGADVSVDGFKGKNKERDSASFFNDELIEKIITEHKAPDFWKKEWGIPTDEEQRKVLKFFFENTTEEFFRKTYSANVILTTAMQPRSPLDTVEVLSYLFPDLIGAGLFSFSTAESHGDIHYFLKGLPNELIGHLIERGIESLDNGHTLNFLGLDIIFFDGIDNFYRVFGMNDYFGSNGINVQEIFSSVNDEHLAIFNKILIGKRYENLIGLILKGLEFDRVKFLLSKISEYEDLPLFGFFTKIDIEKYGFSVDDHAMPAKREDLGGIDMKSIKIDAKGEMDPIKFDADFIKTDGNIQGVVPVIIQINPVNNILPFLGLQPE